MNSYVEMNSYAHVRVKNLYGHMNLYVDMNSYVFLNVTYDYAPKKIMYEVKLRF